MLRRDNAHIYKRHGVGNGSQLFEDFAARSGVDMDGLCGQSAGAATVFEESALGGDTGTFEAPENLSKCSSALTLSREPIIFDRNSDYCGRER